MLVSSVTSRRNGVDRFLYPPRLLATSLAAVAQEISSLEMCTAPRSLIQGRRAASKRARETVRAALARAQLQSHSQLGLGRGEGLQLALCDDEVERRRDRGHLINWN